MHHHHLTRSPTQQHPSNPKVPKLLQTFEPNAFNPLYIPFRRGGRKTARVLRKVGLYRHSHVIVGTRRSLGDGEILVEEFQTWWFNGSNRSQCHLIKPAGTTILPSFPLQARREVFSYARVRRTRIVFYKTFFLELRLQRRSA